MNDADAAAAKAEYIRRKYLATAPGDESTKAYIASKYLGSGQEGQSKKKKKKIPKRIKKGNIGIIDEEEDSWRQAKVQDDDEDTFMESEEATVTETKSLYTPKTSGWTIIREGEEEEEAEDERPQIVGEVPTMDRPQPRSRETSSTTPSRQMRSLSPSPPSLRVSRQNSDDRDEDELRMSSGHRVGLQTTEQIKAETIRLKKQRDKEMRELDPTLSGRDATTVYRDKSGRKFDVGVLKAEEARRKKEELEKQERMMEWGKGLVQREEKAAEQKRLEEEKNKPLARYADDREFNDELKERELWNDPAAQFLSASKKKKKSRRPTYQGQWAPNRFGIPPGYRWDGVDRSNGFEKDYFLRQNARSARDAEAHAWSVEDM
ncbi:hypothetical protein K450DRAFT_232163 [Umbelopsis ramanniana AG]|uniref:Pre-mRNA-splicing factor CWC26 n=1 Tax=Umbelopsis ramanniana AG TaxID=1314678 RepID=A0AAD5EDB2_UMBRA|nr:uncharacterized protein K450DRAFT_232163 [Umbelopsis ramanniana AG]KAI8581618.1 hypothetical protein K450DRAFT_232163 [Umbelopsis ramanniana AG]